MNLCMTWIVQQCYSYSYLRRNNRGIFKLTLSKTIRLLGDSATGHSKTVAFIIRRIELSMKCWDLMMRKTICKDWFAAIQREYALLCLMWPVMKLSTSCSMVMVNLFHTLRRFYHFFNYVSYDVRVNLSSMKKLALNMGTWQHIWTCCIGINQFGGWDVIGKFGVPRFSNIFSVLFEIKSLIWYPQEILGQLWCSSILLY